MQRKVKMLKLKSPAKLNLYLKVLDKRPDGYHNIFTVFERIGLCDDVILKGQARGIVIKCNHPDVPCDKRNLAYKAAQLLQQHTGTKKGVKITILKRIPPAAGLGGGSSNAATVLKGLNSLWNLKLRKGDLERLGGKIGADVPFFLSGAKLAVGRQTGNLVHTVKPLRGRIWHLLVLPDCRLFTKDIYARLDALREISAKKGSGSGSAERFCLTVVEADVKILCRAFQKNDLTTLAKMLYNDLEKPAEEKYRSISQIKMAFKSCGCRGALMSGSGPGVFGIAGSRKEAMKLRRTLLTMARHNELKFPLTKRQIFLYHTI